MADRKARSNTSSSTRSSSGHQRGVLTPEGKITLFSDQIAMIALAGVLLVALVPMMVKAAAARPALTRWCPRARRT